MGYPGENEVFVELATVFAPQRFNENGREDCDFSRMPGGYCNLRRARSSRRGRGVGFEPAPEAAKISFAELAALSTLPK